MYLHVVYADFEVGFACAVDVLLHRAQLFHHAVDNLGMMRQQIRTKLLIQPCLQTHAYTLYSIHGNMIQCNAQCGMIKPRWNRWHNWWLATGRRDSEQTCYGSQLKW